MRHHAAISQKLFSACLLVGFATTFPSLDAPFADDWPMFRHDAARSGVTDDVWPGLHGMPGVFHHALQWIFTPPHPPRPAWPDPVKEKDRVAFDGAYHVAVVADALFFASSADDKVYCLDAATGAPRWSFITGGPVRIAPAVHRGRVYVGSDDGFAYCLSADDGALIWKMRAAYRHDKVLGNGRMISMWPVRTGVLLSDDAAYFGAGVFPHESLFLCAVNTDDGTLLWRNDACGEIGYTQEFGGMTMQGPLLASEQFVFVPSGRAMPAVFQRDSGKFHSWLSPGGKFGGAWALLTDDGLVAGADGKHAYDPEHSAKRQDAPYAWFPGQELVVAGNTAYLATVNALMALDRRKFTTAAAQRSAVMKKRDDLHKKLEQIQVLARRAKQTPPDSVKDDMNRLEADINALDAECRSIEETVRLWIQPRPAPRAMILAGDVLYLGYEDSVAAVATADGSELGRSDVPGKASGLAVAGGRLYVSTDNGMICCFAPEGSVAHSTAIPVTDPIWPQETDRLAGDAERILAATGIKRGYALVYGSPAGRLAVELAKRSDLQIICVDASEDRVRPARHNLDAAGLYGVRIAADAADMNKLPYTGYFADLIVSESALLDEPFIGSAGEVQRLLKPCGGVLCLPNSDEAAALAAALCSSGEFRLDDSAPQFVKVVRGPLPGAGEWTHQYADPGNTACSDDTRVRGALGVLWFGGPGEANMVERHARAAAPLAKDGRLFVQGENIVMAYDAYNGTKLWERQIPGALRVRVDSDMSNLALTDNALYVAAKNECLRLDPATGDTVRKYPLPGSDGSPSMRWGYLACVNNVLYGTVSPPLQQQYSALWDAMVDEDGSWRDPAAVAAELGLPPDAEADLRRMQAGSPAPDARAYQLAQQAGFMWRAMTAWPAWGSVESPIGAVTERIMAGDSLFALDPDSGELLWNYDGRAIAHPAIAIGNVGSDTVLFLADCSVSDGEREAAMQQRESLIATGVWEGDEKPFDPDAADVRRVLALDAKTGQKRWERVLDLTGCGGDRLGLAFKNEVLCFFGCFSNHDREIFRQGKLAWRRVTALAGADGADLWSRPLNYLRRPVIVDDEILIEPRACDLRTGLVKERPHPLTGANSTWEYVRPGHCCSATSAAPNMFFLRGYFLWYYDREHDLGMLPFGGIRPGCWINTIPANGLVLFPEAAAGCTCSYPVRATVAMAPRSDQRTFAMFVQHGDMTPVTHIAINFGAPGDWRDSDGTLWFAYPHPPSSTWYEYGVPFRLREHFADDDNAYFARHMDALDGIVADKPWLFASGCRGLQKCSVPLLGEGQEPAAYTLRLFFFESESLAAGERTFDIKLQGNVVQTAFDVAKVSGGANVPLVKEFKGILVRDDLTIEFVASQGMPPLLNGIEIIREDFGEAPAR